MWWCWCWKDAFCLWKTMALLGQILWGFQKDRAMECKIVCDRRRNHWGSGVDIESSWKKRQVIGRSLIMLISKSFGFAWLTRKQVFKICFFPNWSLRLSHFRSWSVFKIWLIYIGLLFSGRFLLFLSFNFKLMINKFVNV